MRFAKRREGGERERDRLAADSSNRIAERGCPCYFLHCTFHPVYTQRYKLLHISISMHVDTHT